MNSETRLWPLGYLMEFFIVLALKTGEGSAPPGDVL